MLTITDKRAVTRVREYTYSWWLLEWSSVVGGKREMLCYGPISSTGRDDALG
jgi:hypothetical protein